MVLAIFKEEKEAKAPPVTHTTIINNHYTENHLHVDKQSFENLKN